MQTVKGHTRRFRTLFISDIHLGSRGCQAHHLLDFLRYHDAETIYLVGDIVDMWRLKSSWYWPQLHNDVVQKLLRKVRQGTRMIYLPGNHDDGLRSYYGTHFGGIEVVEQAVHQGADGKRYLVLHGDQFDCVVANAKWLALLGDHAYTVALGLNTLFNNVRRRLGFSYWSFSHWAKLKVKSAVNYIGDFEQAVMAEVRRTGSDGVICGHIHHAAIREQLGALYLNCGDWVESCSAIVEHFDGRMEIVHWVASTAPPVVPQEMALAAA